MDRLLLQPVSKNVLAYTPSLDRMSQNLVSLETLRYRLKQSSWCSKHVSFAGFDRQLVQMRLRPATNRAREKCENKRALSNRTNRIKVSPGGQCYSSRYSKWWWIWSCPGRDSDRWVEGLQQRNAWSFDVKQLFSGNSTQFYFTSDAK